MTFTNSNGQSPATRLLRAIFQKTRGLDRAVRDVAELETGLTEEEARTAWRYLLSEGLIQRFSLEFAARLTARGVDAVENAELLSDIPPRPASARKVFIVHGSGSSAREVVARFVEEMELEPVLLHDPGAHGRTIMEQVEAHNDIAFAILLLTPEDLPQLQPRMEVLMELGYFMGRLGRARICALAVDNTFNLPADLAGVVLDPFDASETWKSALTRNLRAAGLEL
jgi:predicted nucleotide-binding protein